MMLWWYFIWPLLANSLASGQSFSLAMDMYQQMCLLAQPACRNSPDLIQYSTVQPDISKEPKSDCCGFCECEHGCVERGSCCFGYYLSTLQHIKRSTDSSSFRCVTPQLISLPEETLFPKAPDVEQVWMVTMCATNQTSFTSERVTRLCEDPEFETSLTTIVPVSGKYYTYKNIFCAYCSGATEPLDMWKLNIVCTDFLSPSDENILAIIKEKRCNIFYESPHPDAQHCISTSFSISRCNETGLWPKFDKNIDRACRSFTDPFNSTYKNYFCYVCNTREPVSPDSWQCSVPRKHSSSPTPPYSLSYDMGMINKAKSDKLLGCDNTRQFPDLKMMKCRNVFCQRGRLYSSVRKRCYRAEIFDKDYCFSIFIKLTPLEEYTLREIQLKQTSNLLRIKTFVTEVLKDNIEVVREIRLFPKLKESSRNPIVVYLVAQLIVDTKDADILSLYINNMNADIDIKDLNKENSVFKSSLAAYDIISDVNGKREIFVPKYNSLDGDILQQLDLSTSNIYRQFVEKDADNSCLTKESRTLKKTDIFPFIEVGLNEFSMHIENDSLILQEKYLKKVFTSFEYEVHHDVIHLSLEDFIFIYDVMPKDGSYIEISGTSEMTKPYLISAACTCVAFCVFY